MQSRNSASRRETPPLTRGRLLWRGEITDYEGNTPAYAGKTDPQGKTCRRDWKHPRLRGEDRQARRILEWQMETPPLTRGRLSDVYTKDALIRNTPAYAGKTHDLIARLVLVRKHPRLRGEDHRALRELIALTETPPLTRGRPADTKTIERLPGNTPAYAGKTNRYDKKRKADRKHPRLRGEDP